jgi:hypothetical protein
MGEVKPEPNVEVVIEELLLHGFAPSDGPRIAGAVQRELTRLLAEQVVPPKLMGGAEIPRLDGGSFDVSSKDCAEGVGRRVARSLYGGFQS